MPLLHTSRLHSPPTDDAVLETFLDYLTDIGMELYPHQETAILDWYAGQNVILNTPTGSGKTLVATAVQFRAICQGRRSWYTVPVKALANEKFLALCELFGAEQVGMITGDATVNPEAPVICCTAEILANRALCEGAATGIDDVIMDEFHYFSDRGRGVAWQIPLLILSRARFLLMSATLGDTTLFQQRLTELTRAETSLIKSVQRPVPLEYEYNNKLPLEEEVEALVNADRSPIYVVHFSQRACAESAQNLMSRNYCTKEQKQKIADALIGANFRSPYGKEIQKFLRHGIGIHHAGLLPKYRVLVEKLAQRGLLQVICGTDTLGVGVNVPIRTVLFTQLSKYDGNREKTLTARDFHQIAGRAGRRGFDSIGYVVAQAPSHVIANLRAEEKSKESGKKNRALKQKPPDGFVSWDEKTFQKLIQADPERLESRFSVSPGLILNILSRRHEDGCLALRRLIRDSYESDASKKKHRRRAFALFRGLVAGKVISILPLTERTGPTKIELKGEYQEDFSLNQALGLYLIEAVSRLDHDVPDYAVNVLSLIEAILEDPEVILRRQEDKAKTELVNQMKADGLDYDERMERLQEVSYPQPGRDFIYSTYNDFVLRNPWAKESGVHPKSVAREMFEEWISFDDYIKRYKLERSEAILLRHLSDVYKVMIQTVPSSLKTEGVDETEAFFRSMVRGVDSTLLDEWERLRDGESADEDLLVTGSDEESKRVSSALITRNRTAFLRLVRGRVFDFLQRIAQGDKEEAASIAPPAEGVSEDPLDRFAAFLDARKRLRFDPEARNVRHFHRIEIPGQRLWQIEQILIDPDEWNDWSIKFTVDLAASDAAGEVVMRWMGLNAIVD